MENNLMFSITKNTNGVISSLVLMAALAAPTTSMADPTRVSVVDVNKTIVDKVPSYQNVCRNVEIPVYANVTTNGNAGGGALLGMVLGGLLGKGVTGDDGGAAAGAVLGGVIGANESKPKTERRIVGYENERRCAEEVTYTNQRVEVYDYSIMKFNLDGQRYELRFQR